LRLTGRHAVRIAVQVTMNIRTEESVRPTTEAAHPRDARAVPILAKTIYRELKQSGLSEEDIMGVASELLAQVATGLRARVGR
jgi:hypothetical protein